MADLTHLSLFSGIGGLDLAAEWAGFRTVGQCEWADYPRKVLEKHWPGLPRWRDIRTLTRESFYEQTGLESITVLSGGFPCQPFSTAGKRRGKEDDRYLWPEMLRVIQEIRPCWVVGENVAGIVSLELDTVLSDLEGIGYTCQAFIIPACAVDAHHRRDRCAIVAHAKSERCGETRSGVGRPTKRTTGSCEDGQILSFTESQRQQIDRAGGKQITKARCEERQPPRRCVESVSNTDNPRFQIPGHESQFQAFQSENGIEFCNRWPAEPNVGRVAHGVPFRVDKLRCLGNAVVPQQFYPIFRAIADIERSFT